MMQALIVIDMQNGVFTMQKRVYRQEDLIENVQKVVRFAREHGFPVLYTLHENQTFLKKGTDGYPLIQPLSVEEGDLVIHKRHADIFTETAMEETLRQLGVTSLILAGVISNGCVATACLSTLAKGFAVTLVKDGHSTCYANAEKVIRKVNNEMEAAGARVIPADRL